MSRYAEIEADLAEVLADIGLSVTWDGDEYDAMVSEPRVNFDLASGGFSADADFSVKIRRMDLPEEGGPALKDLMTIQGASYVVRGITDAPSSPLLVYHVARK